MYLYRRKKKAGKTCAGTATPGNTYRLNYSAVKWHTSGSIIYPYPHLLRTSYSPPIVLFPDKWQISVLKTPQTSENPLAKYSPVKWKTTSCYKLPGQVKGILLKTPWTSEKHPAKNSPVKWKNSCKKLPGHLKGLFCWNLPGQVKGILIPGRVTGRLGVSAGGNVRPLTRKCVWRVWTVKWEKPVPPLPPSPPCRPQRAGLRSGSGLFRQYCRTPVHKSLMCSH